MISRDYSFHLDEDQYNKLLAWATENRLTGYHGAIGGSVSFDITPTSIGTFVTAYAKIYDKPKKGHWWNQKNPKFRRIEIDLTNV